MYCVHQLVFTIEQLESVSPEPLTADKIVSSPRLVPQRYWRRRLFAASSSRSVRSSLSSPRFIQSREKIARRNEIARMKRITWRKKRKYAVRSERSERQLQTVNDEAENWNYMAMSKHVDSQNREERTRNVTVCRANKIGLFVFSAISMNSILEIIAFIVKHERNLSISGNARTDVGSASE